MRTWNNHEKAEVVQAIIEYNFALLGKHLPNNLLALPKEERETLSSNYLCDKLIVFDTTFERWFQYNAKNGTWKEYFIGGGNGNSYSCSISKNDWINNEIVIDYSSHLISNPVAQLFIDDGSYYSSVIGGVTVDEDFNIKLSTDLPFNGKVVVK